MNIGTKKVNERFNIKINMPEFKYFLEASAVCGLVAGSSFGYEYAILGIFIGMGLSLFISKE